MNIIVTGGASGIGLAIVDELLNLGANVQMSDIHGGDKHHRGLRQYLRSILSILFAMIVRS